MSVPTHTEMLVVVNQRVPHLPDHVKSALATIAITVLSESKHKDKPHLHAVKIAVARSFRKSKP